MSSVRTNSLQFGNNGAVFIDDTSVREGNFGLFYPLSNCVIDSIQTKTGKVGITGIGNLSGKTILAGCPIYGWITEIKLTSGFGIAYNSPGE